MNLLSKTFLIAVIIIAALIAVRFALSNVPQHIAVAAAVSNVTSYIEASYPGSIVNITSINASQYPGSWHIIASVVVNATKACPSYMVYSFDYPQYGFVSRLENNYTENCIVNGVQYGKEYVITSYPIAIAWSYSHISEARSFVQNYGYKNVSVSASYFSTTTLGGQNFTKLWLVKYASQQPSNVLEIGLSQINGTLLYLSNSST